MNNSPGTVLVGAHLDVVHRRGQARPATAMVRFGAADGSVGPTPMA